MKRVLLTLIFIALSLSLSAQGRYTVYDCGSGARVFRTDSRSWAAVTKGEALQENTVLHIRQKGAIKILDNSTRRIYTNVKTGKQSVSSLIQASTKSSNSTFGNLNRQIAKNVKNSDHRGRYYSTYGATTRGEGEVTYADSLYYAIFKGLSTPSSPEHLRLDVSHNDDGTVSFMVKNESEVPYYVTILYGGTSNLFPCLEETIPGTDVIPVAPHSSANLLSYKFMAPSGGDDYYLIASRCEFWTEPIKNALRYMTPPDYSADSHLVQVISSE